VEHHTEIAVEKHEPTAATSGVQEQEQFSSSDSEEDAEEEVEEIEPVTVSRQVLPAESSAPATVSVHAAAIPVADTTTPHQKPPSRVFVAGGPRTCSGPSGRGGGVHEDGSSTVDEMDDGGTTTMIAGGATGKYVDREHIVSGGTSTSESVINGLREKVSTLNERNAQLDREKSALAELLSAKKREYDQMRQHYRDRVNDLEEESQRLKSEKLRLVDKLQLPESERTSLVAQENEIAKLRRRLEESDARCAEVIDENTELKREVKDLQLEIEEMHDQFRDEETAEFRELQRELESTAKACRIVNFKLRKAERRCEQLEAERVQAEEKVRLLEARFRSSDDRQHVLELEEELRMAKEVSVRLHDDVEAVEEKRARYEEELDRVNDLLTESETRRQALQREVDMLVEQLKRHPSGTTGHTLELPKLTTASTTMTKQGSQEIDVTQLMRDLGDSLERENDLREQLRFSEEETKVMRKKLADIEDENESLTMQLHKLSTAKSGRFVPALKRASGGGGGGGEDEAPITEREQELRLQMELAEQEVKVLRRKLDEMERCYDILLDEVKAMRVRVEGHGGQQSGGGTSGSSGAGDGGGTELTSTAKIDELVRDIERLKRKLIEKDTEPERRRGSGGSVLQKSRSLEEQSSETGGHVYQQPYHFDLRMQLETVQQEAKVLQEKLTETIRANELLTTENKKLQILAGRTSSTATAGSASKTSMSAPKGEEEMKQRMRELEADNAALRERVSQLDERTNTLSQELVRAKFRGQQQVELGLAGTWSGGGEKGEASTAWRELRAQVQFLDDECRSLRRKVVDIEADKCRLSMQLKQARGEKDPKDKEKLQELDKEPKEQLKQRIMELENELGNMAAIVRNREEDAERLADEVADNRDDLNRMLESFRRRERELLDDVETLRHKNATLSDLLDLVTERAESTQKELDRCRAGSGGGGGSGGDATAGGDAVAGSATTEAAAQKEWQKRLLVLERQLTEEQIRVQAAEKKLKMVDVPLSEVKDDSRLRQHEKEILVQELALCQKQLKAANDQIAELKERLLTVRESHEDIKEDFAKVSKELAQVREQKETLTSARPGVSTGPVGTSRTGSMSTAVGKLEREPASWRWEKQELERQLKDYKKKLDDIHSEMKRNLNKWKAAGEDIARETQIKEELEKKIEKLREQCDVHKLEAEQNKTKVEELQETLRRAEKQWDKERQILEADKMAAETDARQKDDVIRSKDELIAQKNQLVAEKDAALHDRLESVQQKDQLIQQKDVELEFKERELRMRTDEVTTFRSELNEFRSHLAERDERIRQLDEHVRRRDDRLKEKDDILQQINRRLVEKSNQVSDMDKTIRQVIRKLQARDVDLGLCNAELRRVQVELKTSNERLSELRRYCDALEQDLKRQTAEHQSRLQAAVGELESTEQQRAALEEQLKKVEEEHVRQEETWKSDVDKLQVELKLAAERLHVQDVSKSMNPTEAFRLMMREKETLIADKYKLTDTVNSLRRQLKLAEDKRNVDKDYYERALGEKSKELHDLTTARDRLQMDIARLKQGAPTTSGSVGVNGSAAACDSGETVPRSELERRERQWEAEKATLEEFYESTARNQRDSIVHLHETAAALRRENDVQLQLLQAARRALGDLRNRFDTASVSWTEERQRMQSTADQVERYRQRIGELERSVDQFKSELQSTAFKQKESENQLKTHEAVWKTERTELEEKLKKALESAAVSDGKQGSSTSSSASTRVSEFRSKFEKFGSSKSKKSDAEQQQQQQQHRAELDAQEVCRELQRQLADLERTRADDRKQLLDRLEEQRSTLETENSELRLRNSELEKKAQELAHLQRTVADLQCRLVDDRNQWHLEVSQLQRHLEESQRSRLQQKESISQLLAEIARLRVLVTGLDSAISGNIQSEMSPSVSPGVTQLKPRLRSLTPSAEKLRVLTLSLSQSGSSRTTGNGTTDSSGASKGEDANSATYQRPADQAAIQDLIQAIEMASRLADELNQPVQSTSRASELQRPLASPFKRSLSSAEVTPNADTLLFASSASSHYAAPPRGRGSSTSVGARGWAQARSSSQDDAESSTSGYSTASVDRSVVRRPAAVGSVGVTTSGAASRSSFYTSGTQSAYGSRDASPDTTGRSVSGGGSSAARRITSYPVAPPSMIITPSQTPTRRAASVEPEIGEQPLTSADILRLYEKLNAIERETESDILLAALGVTSPLGLQSSTMSTAADRRGRTMVKSISATGSSPTVNGSSKSAASVGASTSAERPPDRTSGATGRPTSTTGTASMRSASVSPRSARRQFYEEYPYDPSRRMTSEVRPSGTDEVLRAAIAAPQEAAPAARDVGVGAASTSSAKPSSSSSKLSSAASTFFQSIKDKRKLFGAKKSSSVDSPSTATQSSIARIGANVLTEPAAPSTYQPPSIPEPQPSGGGVRSRSKLGLHRRTASVDVDASSTADGGRGGGSRERSASATRAGKQR
jgi:chromosome segregation ATPase